MYVALSPTNGPAEGQPVDTARQTGQSHGDATPQMLCSLNDDSDGQSESTSESPSDLEAIYAFDNVVSVTARERTTEPAAPEERTKMIEIAPADTKRVGEEEKENEDEEERLRRRARNLAQLEGSRQSCKAGATRKLGQPRQRGGDDPQSKPLRVAGPSWPAGPAAVPSREQARHRNGTPVPTGKRAPVMKPPARESLKSSTLPGDGQAVALQAGAGRPLPLVPGWDSLPLKPKKKNQHRF